MPSLLRNRLQIQAQNPIQRPMLSVPSRLDLIDFRQNQLQLREDRQYRSLKIFLKTLSLGTFTANTLDTSAGGFRIQLPDHAKHVINCPELALIEIKSGLQAVKLQICWIHHLPTGCLSLGLKKIPSSDLTL